MVELSDHGTLKRNIDISHGRGCQTMVPSKETLIYHMVELSGHGTLKRNIDISHGRVVRPWYLKKKH